jgi:hypothetical protein
MSVQAVAPIPIRPAPVSGSRFSHTHFDPLSAAPPPRACSACDRTLEAL